MLSKIAKFKLMVFNSRRKWGLPLFTRSASNKLTLCILAVTSDNSSLSREDDELDASTIELKATVDSIKKMNLRFIILAVVGKLQGY